MREIMQEIALAGLYRAGFFQHAAFYGGTALRIFYGLPRFSEDLDFSLLKKDRSFELAPFLAAVKAEFQALGLEVTIAEKTKRVDSAIESAFLKSETIWKEIQLTGSSADLNPGHVPAIKIKIEIDTMPPLDFQTENKLLLKPFSCYILCFTLPGLFAGKLHALLFRKWGKRVKGRDWFDFEWYVRQGIPLDLTHFIARARESGDLSDDPVSPDTVIHLFEKRLKAVDFDRIKEDIVRFIPPDTEQIKIWSPQYFSDLAKHIKYVEL